VPERVVMELNISLKVEVSQPTTNITLDVEESVKGVINFFGDFEPKSIGDNDEDKVYWYMKVFSHDGLDNSLPEYILVHAIPSFDGKRFPNGLDSVCKHVYPQGILTKNMAK
jgi:hypothetical protein